MIHVLVADPPWKFGDNTPGGRGAQYKRMPLERIMGLQLPPLGQNAVLFLWRVAAMQLEALQVAIAWGFVPTADLIWQKLTKNGLPHFGTGHYMRGSAETCIVCVRGNVRPAVRDQRNTFAAKMPYRNGRPWHSAKPDEFYAIVERMYPTAARFELFARTRRDGWTQHGNQLPKLRLADRAGEVIARVPHAPSSPPVLSLLREVAVGTRAGGGNGVPGGSE